MGQQQRIVFFDTEITTDGSVLTDIGAVDDAGMTFHANNPEGFAKFIKTAAFLCGHGIVEFDLPSLKKISGLAFSQPAIDTLFLQSLFFPGSGTLKLGKNEKLVEGELNDPLSDARKAQKIFDACVHAYEDLPEDFKRVLALLLSNHPGFSGFFSWVDICCIPSREKSVDHIARLFEGAICAHADIGRLVDDAGVELAYVLMQLYSGNAALRGRMRTAEIKKNEEISFDTFRFPQTPVWAMFRFPRIARVQTILCLTPCERGCSYCNRRLDIHAGLKQIFGFDSFRTYEGEPLQERAADAAVHGRSLLAIFPTGGGKSLTFQLPALMAYRAAGSLTVVISPLQSLMHDQVEGLKRAGIADVGAINGLLNPLERKLVFECVEDGRIGILYIAPEQLRSKSVRRALLKRNIVRFVIDEAHCFSGAPSSARVFVW